MDMINNTSCCSTQEVSIASTAFTDILNIMGKVNGFPIMAIVLLAGMVLLLIVCIILAVILCKRSSCKGNQAQRDLNKSNGKLTKRDDSFQLKYHVSQNNSLSRHPFSVKTESGRHRQIDGNYGNNEQEMDQFGMHHQPSHSTQHLPYDQFTPYMGAQRFPIKHPEHNEEEIRPLIAHQQPSFPHNIPHGLASPHVTRLSHGQNIDEMDYSIYQQEQVLRSNSNNITTPTMVLGGRMRQNCLPQSFRGGAPRGRQNSSPYMGTTNILQRQNPQLLKKVNLPNVDNSIAGTVSDIYSEINIPSTPYMRLKMQYQQKDSQYFDPESMDPIYDVLYETDAKGVPSVPSTPYMQTGVIKYKIANRGNKI